MPVLLLFPQSILHLIQSCNKRITDQQMVLEQLDMHRQENKCQIKHHI
jgi:hypothetical protein